MIYSQHGADGVKMLGTYEASGSLFGHVELVARILARQPLRKIRRVANDALTSLYAAFEALYTYFSRLSIPAVRLIRASMLQVLFSVRFERQLMGHMDYNLMFCWLVGLGIDDPVWVQTVFTKNRDRLLTTETWRKVMVYRPSETLLMLQGGKRRHEWTIRRRY